MVSVQCSETRTKTEVRKKRKKKKKTNKAKLVTWHEETPAQNGAPPYHLVQVKRAMEKAAMSDKEIHRAWLSQVTTRGHSSHRA